jgi:hypothetical protein
MKLSSRKELLKESELTLKSIKKSLNESKKPLNESKIVDVIKNGKETKITLPKKYVIVCHTSTSKLPNAKDIVGKFNSGYYCKGKYWKDVADYTTNLFDVEKDVTNKFEQAEIFTDKDVALWNSIFSDTYGDANDEYYFGHFFEPLEVVVKEQSVINVQMKKTGEKYSKTLVNGKLVK